MMLVDLITPTRQAFFLALKAALTDAQVLDSPPQQSGFSPPVVVVGAIESENAGAKGEQLELMTVEVHILYRGGARDVLIDLAHRARIALHDQPIGDLVDDAGLHPPVWLNTAISSLPSDGVTFVALLTFSIDAEPA
jgi:hypothetical protein